MYKNYELIKIFLKNDYLMLLKQNQKNKVVNIKFIKMKLNNKKGYHHKRN